VFTKPKSKDQSGSKLHHAKKETVGLEHLDDHPIPWGNKEKKRKWGSEKEEEDKMVSSPVFNSGKKVNRKHFRKTLEEDEGGAE